jgi:hypothetical protein
MDALFWAALGAANVPAEEGFPLTIVIALIAVFCSLGVVLLAARKKKP